MNIGYDGKFLSSKSKRNARSGNGVHARELLKHLLMIDSANEYTVYLLDEPASYPAGRCRFKRFSPLSASSLARNALEFPLELYRRPVDILLSFTTAPLFVSCRIILFLADIFWFPHP